jgi:drug/metabolite transporter (DMT)-like permease
MLKGILYLLSAELFFSLATVFVKFVTQASAISGIEIVFFRFFFGFFFAWAFIAHEKISLIPHCWSLVLQRGVYNTIAVVLFFMAVQYTTVTNANMLNMAYPAFIFLISPFMCNEKGSKIQYLYLLLTLLGITLVIRPNFQAINIGDIYGILSAVGAAFGVTTLRKARAFDHTAVILFYLMAIGTIITGIGMLPYFIMPHGILALWIILSAGCGVLGQAAITIGYKYISATAGSLVSASRIIFATTLGLIVFHDPFTWPIALGGGLILISLIGISLQQQ